MNITKSISLFQEAQQIIKEMRAVQRQYLLEGWSGFSEENEKLEYRIGDEVDENSAKLEVPIHLRDQTLGHIMLEGNEEWTPDQQSLVDAIATQAAIAVLEGVDLQKHHDEHRDDQERV